MPLSLLEHRLKAREQRLHLFPLTSRYIPGRTSTARSPTFVGLGLVPFTCGKQRAGSPRRPDCAAFDAVSRSAARRQAPPRPVPRKPFGSDIKADASRSRAVSTTPRRPSSSDARTSSSTSSHASCLGTPSSPSSRACVSTNAGSLCKATQSARVCHVPIITRPWSPSLGIRSGSLCRHGLPSARVWIWSPRRATPEREITATVVEDAVGGRVSVQHHEEGTDHVASWNTLRPQHVRPSPAGAAGTACPSKGPRRVVAVSPICRASRSARRSGTGPARRGATRCGRGSSWAAPAETWGSRRAAGRPSARR